MVTGAGGLLGTELCLQLAPHARVIGVDLPGVKRIADVEWIEVTDGPTLTHAVLDAKPDTVIHGAFRNRKPPDWTEARYVAEAVSNSVALFDAVVAKQSDLLLVSSSAVYGNAGSRNVIDESAPRLPVSAYGRAKAEVEDTAFRYASNGMKLCIVRLFNLIGPREQPGMMLSDWVRQAVALQNGEGDAIYVRHRRTARDFVDVRDAARALVLLATRFVPGAVLNVASGNAISLMDISEELERIAGEKLSFIETGEVDGTDVQSQRGSSRKIEAAVGWQPAIPWQKSLAELWATVASQKRTSM